MKPRQWFAIALVFGISACSWWRAGRHPSPVATDQIKVSHKLHVDQQVDCADCHGKAAEAEGLASMKRPPEAACLECHSAQKDTCAFCHTNIEARKAGSFAQSEMPAIAFSHKEHAPRAKGDCRTCHAGVESSTSLPIARVAMDTCLSCHEHKQQVADAKCVGCHPTLDRVPLRALAQFDHGGNWMARHGMLARSSGAACQQCHVESFCTECHSKVAPAVNSRLYPEQVERTLLHRPDFASTHGLEARADGSNCLRCHGGTTDSFCASCHASLGLTPDGRNPRTPHPSGYVRSGEHGRDARLHTETCASCHDQGANSNCVDCHRVGGVGGNPHPAGFTSAHPHSEISHNAMCRYCHSP